MQRTQVYLSQANPKKKLKLRDSLGVLVKWFGENSMKVNVSKFQFLLLERSAPREMKMPRIISYRLVTSYSRVSKGPNFLE